MKTNTTTTYTAEQMKTYTESVAPHLAAIDAAFVAFQKTYNAAMLTTPPETREAVVHRLCESYEYTAGRHFAAIDELRRLASLAGVNQAG